MKVQKMLLLLLAIFAATMKMEAQSGNYDILKDTVMNTPNGDLKVEIGYFKNDSIYSVWIEETRKLKGFFVPFEGKAREFWEASHNYIIPLFEETFPTIYQLIESGKLLGGNLYILCDSHKNADKGFVFTMDSKELKYLNMFIKEITKDGRLLKLIKKSMEQLYAKLPQPSEYLKNEYKSMYKDEEELYTWKFAIQMKKKRFKEFDEHGTVIW